MPDARAPRPANLLTVRPRPTMEPLEGRRMMSAAPVAPAAAAVGDAPAGADTAGPQVIREQILGPNKAVQQIILTFNESLDPATAQDPLAYLVIKKKHKKEEDDDGGFFSVPFSEFTDSGSSGGTTIIRLRFDAAVYDDATHTVTLTPHRNFRADKRFRQVRVIARGQHAIKDAAGNPLDGNGDGKNGDNATIKLKAHRGPRLGLRDTDGDVLKLRLTGPGQITSMTHRKGTPDPLIFLENTVPGQSVLTGTVKKGKKGDGVFSIAQITGTSTAQINFLTDPAFQIGMTQP